MTVASPDSTPLFKVVIVGGGLGGLATALCLARKGHNVTVLEGAKGLNEVGAGIQIPPNSSRILCKEWDLRDKLLEKVVWPSNINMRRYASGKVIGKTPLHPRMTEKYSYPYWLIHRADYQRILYDAAIDAGAKVHLGCRVVEITEQPPSVSLADGTKFFADVIVGADGIRSRVRQVVMPDEIVHAKSSANCAFRATIPASVMLSDPELAPLMTNANSNCWIGYRRHIMAYPIRNGTLYNMVMSHPGEAEAGKWNEPGNLEEMRYHYRNFNPIVRKLLTHVTSCLKWKLADLPQLSNWVSPAGTVVLIGDACHAMVPYLAQGAAQAIEDAATIGECLDRARSKDDIFSCLHAFEKIRKRRCEKIQRGSLANGQTWHLPDGEEQEERDEGMRAEADAEAAANITITKAKNPNPNQWSDEEFQPWLFGHDAVKHANEKLNEIYGC